MQRSIRWNDIIAFEFANTSAIMLVSRIFTFLLVMKLIFPPVCAGHDANILVGHIFAIALTPAYIKNLGGQK